MGAKIGINAVRARSGGAKSHLVGLLNNVDPSKFGFDEVHIWGNAELLLALPNYQWLFKHHPTCRGNSIIWELVWERMEFPRLLRNANISLLFNVDAGSICSFQPAVTASRDMLSYEAGEMMRFGLSWQRLRLLILKFVQNLSLKKAKGVIFLTEYAAKVIQKSCGTLPRTAYVPHGVSDDFKKVCLRPFPERPRQISILYVSNVALYKHQLKVVEGVARLRERGYSLKLILVGGGETAELKRFKQSLAKWDPQSEFVELHPFVDHKKIPTYLAQADVFVFASSCENMPNTLLEAMAAGLPIACSDRGPMPELLKDGGLYFDPEKAETICSTLEQLICNSSQREELARRAKKLSNAYSWERCARETFSFLSETLTTKAL
jgi:glycosyltransferase involved in cell wall biosynthesis